MIPSNRPVAGKDLVAIKEQFGLSTADAAWLFGISITRWSEIANKGYEQHVTDPTLALLVRLLDQHPELPVVPKAPSAAEMFAMVNQIVPADQKRFSILMGSEASASYRWLKKGGRQPAVLQRLFYFLSLCILSRTEGDRIRLMDGWATTVADEAKARGVADVFQVGRWTPGARSANDEN